MAKKHSLCFLLHYDLQFATVYLQVSRPPPPPPPAPVTTAETFLPQQVINNPRALQNGGPPPPPPPPPPQSQRGQSSGGGQQPRSNKAFTIEKFLERYPEVKRVSSRFGENQA